MTLRILIDMNLTPAWAPVLQAAGWEAIHWSHIGAPDAADSAIMTWAQQNHFVVFTHDLDFSALLAASNASGPSVIQVRTQNTLPDAMFATVEMALRRFVDELERGAIVIVEPSRVRARILPLRRRES
jgi:predicted nuclease of predicted toxin-antitoxin system